MKRRAVMMNNGLIAALAGVLLTVMCVAGGCNYLGPALYLAEGPGTVPAEYELADVPTVVFVDDRANVIAGVGNARALRITIAERVCQDLMVKKVLTTTISPRDAMGAVLASDRFSEPMAIDQIAREVGAEQIIYIEMLGMVEAVNGVPRPSAAVRLRVVDAVNRMRLYPASEGTESARTLQTTVGEVDPGLLRSTSSRLKIFQALAEETGQEIAKLFYEHERIELGERLNSR